MRAGLGGGTKKLLIAVSHFFGDWSPEGGATDCPICHGEGTVQDAKNPKESMACEDCRGEGCILYECPAAECFPELDFEDTLLAAWLAYSTREKAWTIKDWLEQPAKWAAAAHFLWPYIFAEIERRQEREREEMRWRLRGTSGSA